ncbi:hypothetical protein E2C01_099010 [Portunus trituberculatus]|uniref:Uncharacterized protein n=1 Tax=Portunus trituberculatus TaxID=210409 RepID=A0A5B7K9Q0_PORTR|nr:hypothetical protein [Portunus trituberculatus]
MDFLPSEVHNERMCTQQCKWIHCNIAVCVNSACLRHLTGKVESYTCARNDMGDARTVEHVMLKCIY